MSDKIIPQHIAFIPDGNRRYGRENLNDAEAGHMAGVETIKTLVDAARKTGIPYVTFYVFSTENWKRTNEEVSYLMKLFHRYFADYKNNLGEDNITIKFIGRRDRISDSLRKIIKLVENATKHDNPACTVTFALDYGGQDELVRAFKRMIKKLLTLRLNPFKLSTATISDNLDTAGIPPPDLVVRTSGEQRLSNFLTWQTAYSELYFTDTHWPAFDKQSFKQALDWYATRERRLGGDSKAK